MSATWLSLRRQAKLGMPGPVGAFAVAAPLPPASTMRTMLSARTWRTVGLPASGGKIRLPLPLRSWQAAQLMS